MERIRITLRGRLAEVDADQAKLLVKKQALVQQVLALKNAGMIREASEISGKIIALNRRIRPTVIFLD